MTPLVHAFTSALLYFLVQGALVAALLRVFLSLLARQSAALRYAVCCAALLLLIVLPPITTWTLYQQTGHVVRTVSATPTPRALPSVTPAPLPLRGSNVAALFDRWAVPIWCIGVLFFSIRIAWAYGYVARHRRTSESAPPDVLEMVASLSRRMGVTGRVQVLFSALADGPSVVGWLRPVILLPFSAVTGLTPDQLEAVLAHELAHIRRHDYLVNLLQMAAEALLFYHPAVWWVSGRIRAEREFCCDDLAVRTCQSAVTYARALSSLEKLRPAIPAIALGSTGGPLLTRIQRILGKPVAECGPSRTSAALALSVVLACVAAGYVRAQATDATTSSKEASVSVIARGWTITYQTPIEYPKSAIAAGHQGRVCITLSTDAAGNVKEASLIQNALVAPPDLQELVLESVKKWRVTDGPSLPEDRGLKYIVVIFTLRPPMSAAEKFAQQGDQLFRAGKIDEALHVYQQGEQTYPDDRVTFMKRQIEVFIRQGNNSAAYQRDMDILKTDPHDAEARGLQASFLLDQGAPDDALAILKDVVQAKPDNFVARFNLGRAYFAKDQVIAAANQFENALRLRPDYAPAHLALAQLAMKTADYPTAKVHVDAVLARSPKNEGALKLQQALQERHQ